tara:strand:+ start:118 stop:621 length:504 start_codon:yes stop_codon:yes gene_type:complete
MGIFDIFKGSDLNFKGVNVKEINIIATEIDNKVKKIIPILEELLKKNISKEKFQTELKNKKIDFHDEITWETQIILGDDKNFKLFNGLTMFVEIEKSDLDFRLQIVGVSDLNGFYLEYDIKNKVINAIAQDLNKLLKMNRPGKELTDRAIALSEEFNNFKGYKVSRI